MRSRDYSVHRLFHLSRSLRIHAVKIARAVYLDRKSLGNIVLADLWEGAVIRQGENRVAWMSVVRATFKFRNFGHAIVTMGVKAMLLQPRHDVSVLAGN